MGDYQRAIADFTRAIELRPEQSTTTYYQRALAFIGLGKLDNAIVDLEKVVALTKDLVAPDMVALRKAAEQELGKLRKSFTPTSAVGSPTSMPVTPTAIPTRALPTSTSTAVLSTATSTPVPPTAMTSPPPPALAAGPTRVSDKDGMVMLYVPEGEFLIGSTDADTEADGNEKPQHKVYLDAFWIDQTEVTNKMFARFTSETRYKTGAETRGSSWTFNVSTKRWEDTKGAAWQHPRGPDSDIKGLEQIRLSM